MVTESLNIIFAGTPAFAAEALQALQASQHKVIAVYTQPDRPAGRGRKMLFSPVKQLALEYQLPIYQPLTLKNEAEQEQLAQFKADLMVVAAYGLLLPLPILTAPRLGCINIHASLLPRWRGAAPIQRAILAGDQQTGVVIMQMEEGLDTGPMLYEMACPILGDDTSASLHDKLAKLGSEALLHTLEQIVQGKVQAEIQNHSAATYAHKIKKEEAMLNWQSSAIELEQQIRAFYAWPVAYTYLGEQVLRVWQATVLASTTAEKKPGTIMHASAQGIDVATGQGVLRLLQVQLPGGRVLPVGDILNARQQDFAEGISLGLPL